MKKLIIIFFLVIVAVIVVISIIGFNKTNQLPSYGKTDENRPIAELKDSSFDFGKINSKDVLEHIFTLKNNGKNDLEITQITTSCDCTSAYIIQDQATSPRFNMHIQSGYKTAIKPGQDVQVKAVYDPKVMPEKGVINRFITMASNDPNAPKLEFKLIMDVQS